MHSCKSFDALNELGENDKQKPSEYYQISDNFICNLKNIKFDSVIKEIIQESRLIQKNRL